MNDDGTRTQTQSPEKKKWTAGTIALVVVGLLGALCCCTGVGAAFAIPALIRYVKQAKVVEATIVLDALRESVETHCRAQGAYPGAAGPLPPSPSSERQLADFGTDPVFRSLGITQNEPIYFSYAIEPNAEGVSLVAYGDLDGNGVRSERRIQCGEGCTCGPVSVRNELE